jgi:hypothetical protein
MFGRRIHSIERVESMVQVNECVHGYAEACGEQLQVHRWLQQSVPEWRTWLSSMLDR